MERRTFFKISAITGATAALDSCGKPEHQLIRFIPDDDLVPGVAAWKPSICTLCPAGCGLMVRVMADEAEVVRNGQLGLLKMGVAKKLEGNPDHPVNHGKLCARGQAGLQVTYHPDRLRNPLRRSGPRGSGEFAEITWDEATKELVSQLTALRSGSRASTLAFLTKPLRGQRRELIDRFLKSFGAPPALTFETFDEAVLRRANLMSFGRAQLPTFDLAHAEYVLSLGADFLATWNSPVSQGVGYGEFRRGGSAIRGHLVQVEPRMSPTGANADLWVPIKPGTEGILALGVAQVIISQKLRPTGAAGSAGALIPGWTQSLSGYTPHEVEQRTGVPAATITRIAHEMAKSNAAMAIIGGAPLAQTNGLFNALAVNALNSLLGSVGKPGGILFTPQPPFAGGKPETALARSSYFNVLELVRRASTGRTGISGVSSSPLPANDNPATSPFGPANVLLIYDANPVFAQPGLTAAAFDPIPFIASFGSFIDETSILSDLILPDHSPLESWLDDVPESGSTVAVASLAPPTMHPLHNTRQMPDILLDVARQLGGDFAKSLPWKTYDEMLKAQFEALRVTPGGAQGGKTVPSADDFWKKVQDQGGWWSEKASVGLGGAPNTSTEHAAMRMPPLPASKGGGKLGATDPQFDGEEGQYPFHLLPYASLTLYDGSLAHLPWMQETPEVLSSAMWSTWVEINPKTAEKLGVELGDLVEIASQHGKVQVPVLIFPGIAPDVVAMPAGQGHEHFTRYASQRGANPLAILAPVTEPETGSLAWAATRVKVSKLGGKGKLILFAGSLRENEGDKEPR